MFVCTPQWHEALSALPAFCLSFTLLRSTGLCEAGEELLLLRVSAGLQKGGARQASGCFPWLLSHGIMQAGLFHFPLLILLQKGPAFLGSLIRSSGAGSQGRRWLFWLGVVASSPTVDCFNIHIWGAVSWDAVLRRGDLQ